MSIPLVLGMAALLNAGPPSVPAVPEGGPCITGFCPAPAQTRMPGGPMFLAVGLVGVGIAGLRRERIGGGRRG